MNNKIAMVITYFGRFPSYLPYFLKTCSYNQGIDFLIFTDDFSGAACLSAPNINFFKTTIEDFNALASARLDIEVSIKGGYKLCDFKPMYGKIYADKLVGYDFWGFCDIDILFGNLANLINENLLNKYDVISAHSQYLSGPFSLFRNTEEVNSIFTKSKDVKKVIKEDNIFLFDEASNVISHLWEGGNIFDFTSEVESMTHILMNKDKCALRVCFGGFISERIYDEIVWDNGLLRDIKDKELFIFHYIVYKSKLAFTVPKYRQEEIFYFGQFGFRLESLKSKTLDRVYSLIRNFSYKASGKMKRMF